MFLGSMLLARPFSIEDRHISILYTCDLNGNFEFDHEGRKGLSLISELKRQEIETIFDNKGGVLLLSKGGFFEKGLNNASFSLMKTALFDGIVLSEEEMNYLENNPNLLKLNLPILSPRENILDINSEKIFQLNGINIKMHNYFIPKRPHGEKETIHLNLVFPDDHNEISKEEIPEEIPVVFFTSEEKSSAYSYWSNVSTASCPSDNSKIGKIKLVFRKEKLIRFHQEFLPLNTIDSNRSWIYPHREVLKELQRN